METVPVYTALDFPSFQAAEDWLMPLKEITHVKVGLELFLSDGPGLMGFFDRLQEDGRKVFLDLKLHDIPNTVAGAVRSLGRLNASHPGLLTMTTLHALGGAAMMRAAKDARDEVFGPDGLKLLGVTVLTSHGNEDTARAWGGGEGRAPWVRRLTGQTKEAGLDGVVTSVAEAPLVREIWGDPPPLIVTPGIRWSAATQDQKSVATPEGAVAAGATHLVVGRPITQAPDPAAAYRECVGRLG